MLSRKLYNLSLLDTLGNVSLKTKNIECLTRDISIAPTSDNGFVMTMVVEKKLSENRFIYTGEVKVLRYDNNAQLVWEKTITGINNANVIEVTNGFLIGGNGSQQNSLKALLIKLDKNGYGFR